MWDSMDCKTPFFGSIHFKPFKRPPLFESLQFTPYVKARKVTLYSIDYKTPIFGSLQFTPLSAHASLRVGPTLPTRTWL